MGMVLATRMGAACPHWPKSILAWISGILDICAKLGISTQSLPKNQSFR